MEHFLSYLTEEQLTEWFQSYRAFGPAAAAALPFIEAFLPFLPLVVFVVANTNAFGLWEGFFLSWLGSAAGSILMFYAVRCGSYRCRSVTGEGAAVYISSRYGENGHDLYDQLYRV